MVVEMELAHVPALVVIELQMEFNAVHAVPPRAKWGW
jgi:hypothetical protein